MAHDPVTSRVLRSVAEMLKTRIMPGVGDASAAAELEMGLRVLDWLARRADDADRDYDSDLAALSDEAASLLATEVPCAGSYGGDWSRRAMAAGLPRVTPPNPGSIFASLAGALQHLQDAGRQEGAADLFRRFLAREEAHIAALDPGAAANIANTFWSGRAAARGSETKSATAVTEDSLTAYLKRRFPDRPAILARDIRPLVGGFGRDTILFTLDGDPVLGGDVVMRNDPPVLGLRTTVLDELPLIEAARAKGVLAPEPLWAEPDAGAFGGAFIAFRRALGTNDIGSWARDPDACRRFARDLARTMVRIHAIRPRDAGFSEEVGRTAAEAQQRHVYWLHELYRVSVAAPNPRIEAAFGWLFANTPVTTPREPSLVHCGLGFHNLLMRDGAITAVLDWEFSHFGDPADDLGYTRPFIEKLMPWPEFLAMYRDFGGAEYSEDQDRYYAIWRGLRNACACVSVASTYFSSDFESVKLAAPGLIHGPRFELAALREIENALRE